MPNDKVFVKASLPFPFHDGYDPGDGLIPLVVIDPLHMLLWIYGAYRVTVRAL